MRSWAAGGLAISLSLVCCGAKSAPTRITAKVADTYSGRIRLSPCQKDGEDPVLVDEQGNGKTQACPLGGDVEIVVIRAGKTIYIAREKINVARAGDGLPVMITTAIP